MKTVGSRTLEEELVGLARALQPLNGDGRSAVVWTLGDGARPVFVAPDAPAELVDAATERLARGDSRFEIEGELGARGLVHLCVVGSERVAYGLFIHGAGRAHLAATIPQLIDMAQNRIGKEIAAMSRTEKQQVVHFLDERGVFLIRRAVEDVAERLGVSRFTIYNYLDREER
jgi:HTH domain